MNTALGIQVKDIMNRGELVSDELVLKIVRHNLVKDNKGWILDCLLYTSPSPRDCQ